MKKALALGAMLVVALATALVRPRSRWWV